MLSREGIFSARPQSGSRSQSNSQPKEALWKATPCTIPYVSICNSFDHSDRFRLFSIYHKDDVNKPKPVFNDIEKPELLLQHFRREIAQASSDRFKKRNSLQRRSSEKNKLLGSLDHRSKSRQSDSPDKLVTDRLYQVTKKQDGRYDRFGIRCNLEEEPSSKHIGQQPSQQKSFSQSLKPDMSQTHHSARASFLTSARRLDLSRPLNYYPAPNSYRLVDFLQEKKWTPAASRTSSLIARRLSHGSTVEAAS